MNKLADLRLEPLNLLTSECTAPPPQHIPSIVSNVQVNKVHLLGEWRVRHIMRNDPSYTYAKHVRLERSIKQYISTFYLPVITRASTNKPQTSCKLFCFFFSFLPSEISLIRNFPPCDLVCVQVSPFDKDTSHIWIKRPP